MPKYPKKCKDCGHEFEVELKITEDNNVPCTECTGETHTLMSGLGKQSVVDNTRWRKGILEDKY